MGWQWLGAPVKGFEYLFLNDEDFNSLSDGAVNAHKVPEG